jgi:hypothetical protein
MKKYIYLLPLLVGLAMAFLFSYFLDLDAKNTVDAKFAGLKDDINRMSINISKSIDRDDDWVTARGFYEDFLIWNADYFDGMQFVFAAVYDKNDSLLSNRHIEPQFEDTQFNPFSNSRIVELIRTKDSGDIVIDYNADEGTKLYTHFIKIPKDNYPQYTFVVGVLSNFEYNISSKLLTLFILSIIVFIIISELTFYFAIKETQI